MGRARRSTSCVASRFGNVPSWERGHPARLVLGGQDARAPRKALVRRRPQIAGDSYRTATLKLAPSVPIAEGSARTWSRGPTRISSFGDNCTGVALWPLAIAVICAKFALFADCRGISRPSSSEGCSTIHSADECDDAY